MKKAVRRGGLEFFNAEIQFLINNYRLWLTHFL
jgi:hypothetical protein